MSPYYYYFMSSYIENFTSRNTSALMLTSPPDKNAQFGGYISTEIDETAYEKLLKNPLNMGID